MIKVTKALLCVLLSLTLVLCSGCFYPSEEPLSSDAHDYHGSYKDPIPFGEEFEITDSKLTYTLKIDQVINGKNAKKYVQPSDWEEPGELEYIIVLFTVSVKELKAYEIKQPIEVKGHQEKTGQVRENWYWDSKAPGEMKNIAYVDLSSPGTFQTCATFYASTELLTHLMIHHKQSGRYYYFALK